MIAREVEDLIVREFAAEHAMCGVTLEESMVGPILVGDPLHTLMLMTRMQRHLASVAHATRAWPDAPALHPHP